MSVRVVQPASGAAYLQFSYGDGTEVLTRGQILDVVPGSAVEAAIGSSNLVPLTGQQLVSAQNGAEGGAVSN